MKNRAFMLLSVLLILALAACTGPCEHRYGNACEAICRGCGEARTVGEHDYDAADCDTPKTCKICGATDGEALGHRAEADGGSCTVADACFCGYTVRVATDHTPDRDDGNCLTEIKCSVCGKTAAAGSTEHSDTDHDDVCDNPGCQIALESATKDESEGIDLPIVWN